MNTFSELYSQYIFRFNPQDGDKGYSHYLGLTNFKSVTYKDFCIYTSMRCDTYFTINDCLFSDIGSNLVIRNTDNGHIYITNCIFDQYIRTDFEFINIHLTNTSVIENPQTINNVLFITENLYKAENAYSCQKDKYPDNVGCAHDRFEFTFGDVVYTQKHHDDADTPSPSIVFTQSGLFSQICFQILSCFQILKIFLDLFISLKQLNFQ